VGRDPRGPPLMQASSTRRSFKYVIIVMTENVDPLGSRVYILDLSKAVYTFFEQGERRTCRARRRLPQPEPRLQLPGANGVRGLKSRSTIGARLRHAGMIS